MKKADKMGRSKYSFISCGLILLFLCSYAGAVNAADHSVWNAEWIGAANTGTSEERETSGVTVRKALYGVRGDSSRQVDLLQKVQQQTAAGNFDVVADNATAGRDPAPETVKKRDSEQPLTSKERKQ